MSAVRNEIIIAFSELNSIMHAQCPQNGQTHFKNFAASAAGFYRMVDHFVDPTPNRVSKHKKCWNIDEWKPRI